MFRIYPAVDIKSGRCVRLYRGDMDRQTVYDLAPWEAAREWERQGASVLHVVDLDGAAAGRPVNVEAVRKLIRSVSIPVQVGGGVRDEGHLRIWLSAGASRVVLGTAALIRPDFLKRMVSIYGDRVSVSVDMAGEKVMVAGWSEKLQRGAGELADELEKTGVGRVVYTDVDRDGTLAGFQGAGLGIFLDRGWKVIVAGGIGSMDDIRRLKVLVERGVEGVIIGKALYEGRIELAEALLLEETGNDPAEEG